MEGGWLATWTLVEALPGTGFGERVWVVCTMVILA